MAQPDHDQEEPLLAQLTWTDGDLAAWLRAAVRDLECVSGTVLAAVPVSGGVVTVGDLVSAAAMLGVRVGHLLLATVRGRTSAFAVVDTRAVAAVSGPELAPARRWAGVQPPVGVLDCAELVEVAAACGMSAPRLWQVLAEAQVLLPDACPGRRDRLAPVVAERRMVFSGVGAQLREARLAHPDLGLLELRSEVGAGGLANWEMSPRGVEGMPLSVYLSLCERLRVGASWVLDRACVLRSRPWWPVSCRRSGGRGDSRAVSAWCDSSGWRADTRGVVMVHRGALPTLALALDVGLAEHASRDGGPTDWAPGQPLPTRLRRSRLSVCPE